MLLSLLETILEVYLLHLISEQDTKAVQSPEDHNSEIGMHIFFTALTVLISNTLFSLLHILVIMLN